MTTSEEHAPTDMVPRVAETFVELVDVLVRDLDPSVFFGRLTARVAELVPVADAGVAVDGPEGVRVAAATVQRCRDLETWQIAEREGPSVDCRRLGVQVAVHDLATIARWSRFGALAATAGYLCVHAFPLRLRHEVIGTLTTYSATQPPLDHLQVRLVQSLADVATIALLQKRALRRSEQMAEQLQAALHSRVVIEQAKGAIAYLCRCTVDEAFVRLRRYSRSRRVRLEEVARLVFDDASVRAALMEDQ